MFRRIVVKGRVVDRTTVRLEEPFPEHVHEVEVTAQVEERSEGKLSDYLRSLPPGSRSKQDIDRQIRQERGSCHDPLPAGGPSRGARASVGVLERLVIGGKSINMRTIGIDEASLAEYCGVPHLSRHLREKETPPFD